MEEKKEKIYSGCIIDEEVLLGAEKVGSYFFLISVHIHHINKFVSIMFLTCILLFLYIKNKITTKPIIIQPGWEEEITKCSRNDSLLPGSIKVIF